MIPLDEVGYMPLADIGAEFQFHLISDRGERGTHRDHEFTVLGMDDGVSEPGLCKALLDRITNRAHISETGTASFRFRRTMEWRKKY